MKRVNIRIMKQGKGELVECYLESGEIGGKILCARDLIPAPGQYILAHDSASHNPTPASLFNAGQVTGGFLAAPPIPRSWVPGKSLSLRGRLGRGFRLPNSAQRVAFVAYAKTIAGLRTLLTLALDRNASVILMTDIDVPDLPPEVEIQPLSDVGEVLEWADYLAIDVIRDSLPGLLKKLALSQGVEVKLEAQALVHTPMPCGAMAECTVCAVKTRRGWKMACKDGPVFDLKDLV